MSEIQPPQHLNNSSAEALAIEAAGQELKQYVIIDAEHQQSPSSASQKHL